MRIDPENPKHIIAEDGKVFRRIVENKVLCKEIILGYHKYDGVYRMETPEDFDEVDAPDEPENPDFIEA